jgi:hypothetical protein
VRGSGIDLGALWRYALPAVVQVPALAALRLAGPRSGAMIIGVAVGIVALAVCTPRLFGGLTPVAIVVRLKRAITLSDGWIEPSPVIGTASHSDPQGI